jgi:hypothetical protein
VIGVKKFDNLSLKFAKKRNNFNKETSHLTDAIRCKEVYVKFFFWFSQLIRPFVGTGNI